MPRSSSSEPTKSSKRKGTRSVSSLTPAQLARKRANDREAQRAIRARTKDHIDRLEREIDELRGAHSLDKTVQDLLRRNRTLEDEVKRLREKLGVTSSPFSPYDDNLSNASGAMPSPRTSPFPTGEYSSTPPTSMPDYTQQQQFVPQPSNIEVWTAGVPNPVHSNVSSPTSSAADDFGPTSAPAYIPTSMPSNVVNGGNGKGIKLEFDDRLFNQPNVSMQAAAFMPEAQQPWTAYPMFYPQQIQSPVH